MGKKFDKIFESVVSTYNVGGYAPGHIVKFRPNYKSCACYKAMPTAMQDEVDELASSGLNIIVQQVGDKLSGASAGNQHKTADNAVITIAGDHGGGRVYNSVTVSPDMIDLVSTDRFSAKVPDQFRREDKTNYKPEVFKVDTTHITRQTNKNSGIGGKNTPTNIKLAGESSRMTRDAENMALIYENIGQEHDYELIYENYMLDEGFLRRLATKFSGGGRNNPLRGTNRMHEFAKSVALDAGKDISKSFGGDYNTHAKSLYNSILAYLQKLPQQ